MSHLSLPIDRTALFLDLDGTIVDIAATPEEARADHACIALLDHLRERLGGRLAILSGRAIATVDQILHGVAPCVAGVHGLQRRTATGEIESSQDHPRVADAAAVLEALASAQPGLQVEFKGPSVAIHYRQAPAARDAVLETVDRLARASGLEVQRGKAVAELRTPGADKATALRMYMLEPPFIGATPLFLGDDLTDEPALQEAAHLGGVGIRVGRRSGGAYLCLPDPTAVLAWLAQSLDRGAFDLEGAQWED